jgi:allantoin racemase
LHALRELLNIPVLGLCEASVLVACMMGACFSVVNVNSKFTRCVAENTAAYGLAGRLVSIDQMAVECGAALNRGFEDETTRAAVVEAFCSAAGRGSRKVPRP